MYMTKQNSAGISEFCGTNRILNRILIGKYRICMDAEFFNSATAVWDRTRVLVVCPALSPTRTDISSRT